MHVFFLGLVVAAVLGWFAQATWLGVAAGIAGLICAYVVRGWRSTSGVGELAAGFVCIALGLLVISSWVGFGIHRALEHVH